MATGTIVSAAAPPAAEAGGPASGESRGRGALLRRLRADRGQVAPLAVVLLCGVLTVLFVGLLGLGEGRIGVSALQASADAAASAAADTARRVETAMVSYRDVLCVQHVGHGGRVSYPCFPRPTQTVLLSGPASELQGGSPPGWALQAGCSMAEPATARAAGTYGPYCRGERVGAQTWAFSQNTADIAAQDVMDANMPTLGGTVTIQAVRLADGTGRASVTLSLDESRNAITQDLHRPVVLVVTGTATPGGQAGVGS